jgi:TolA-binding protein
LRLAESIGQQNEIEEALVEFERVVILYGYEPWASEAQYQIGLCWEALNESEKAASAFEKLVERYPQSPHVDDAKKRLESG